ncbi:competence protein CoiA family protein [Legionella saoudiensis]|uniref:competence protein CoiA family protein n=1 Tax=Legionella saoudiensis TaxID=1750561 RepID=UPI00072FF7FF|nr:competence protein CoiA family protein [Legionella saoudiensis]
MKKEDIKLPFGLNEQNNLVHIADVERSSTHSYFCPSCKSPLTPAKGRIKQHHFKHAMGSECGGGLESAIHLAAKQQIMKHMHIMLPEYVSIAQATDSKGKNHREQQEYIGREGKMMSFPNIEEEKVLHGMKADLLATKGEHFLIIEIYYRHRVDEQKIEKIKKANISAIEINLSDLQPDEVKDMDSFWLSLNNSKRMQWLHNAKAHAEFPMLEKKLLTRIEQQEEQYKLEMERDQKKEDKERAQLSAAVDELLLLLRSESKSTRLHGELEQHPAWNRYCQSLGLSIDQLPDYLNLAVPYGDWIFGCDRRIWQAVVYCTFISGNKDTRKGFSIQRVNAWLIKSAQLKIPSCAETVARYARRYPELIPVELKNNVPSSWGALRAFFNNLCKLDLIMYIDSDYHYPGSCWYSIVRMNSK